MATETTTDAPGVFARLQATVTLRRLLAAYALVVGLFVYLPILSLLGFSVNAGGLSFPFTEFTLRWYEQLAADESMRGAIWRSLQLATATMVITTVFATAMAFAYRLQFAGKRAVLYLMVLGIVVPGITYGIGATLFLNELLDLSKGLWLALTVHVVWTLPFSFIVLLAGFPPELAQNERAARVLGADRVTVFREIVFPQIAPTVLGAAVFAFTLSYNESTRSLLIIGQRNTMPIEVFAIASSRRPTPMLFALGAITTVLSVVALSVAGAIVLRRSTAGEGGE